MSAETNTLSSITIMSLKVLGVDTDAIIKEMLAELDANPIKGSSLDGAQEGCKIVDELATIIRDSDDHKALRLQMAGETPRLPRMSSLMCLKDFVEDVVNAMFITELLDRTSKTHPELVDQLKMPSPDIDEALRS